MSTETQVLRPGAGRRARTWSAVRWVLVAWWAAVAVASVTLAQQPATLDDLLADVQTGRVGEVTVRGGLEPGWTGSATQHAVWREGPFRYSVEVLHVVPDGADDGGVWDDGERQVVREDLAQRLRAAAPDVVVVTEPHRQDGWNVQVPTLVLAEGMGAAVATWTVVGAPAVALTVGWLAHLWVLVNGPAPRTGSRWGWFWVLLLPPIGPLVHALVAARRSSDPPADLDRAPRGALTGGWGFLLFLVLSNLGGA